MPNDKKTGGSDVKKDDEIDVAPVKIPEAKVDGDLMRVIEKVEAAESILVALSKDPTLDEIAAALGLTMALDGMGKHATAIYSGKTPSVLKFLRPEKTFEKNTNSLQDFIISLSKEKADHLRYKIEGDFVRVYITPYRTTISENDLEFSHGEMNVDLVISINVTEVGDFDAALTKHGRIMHDAAAVNISNAVPGRLGGIEWNRASASSVSEMIVAMIEEMRQPLSEDIATALLTGIEAETERFSNEKTTPEALSLAGKLMEAGANQQLIVANIMRPEKKAEPEEKPDVVEPGSVEISDEDEAEGGESVAEGDKVDAEESPEQQLEKMIAGKKQENDAMKELSVMGGESGEATEQSMEIPNEEVPKIEEQLIAAVPTVEVPVESVYGAEADRTDLNDKTLEPLNVEKPKDFGAMIEEALAEPTENPAIQAAPAVQTGVEGAMPGAEAVPALGAQMAEAVPAMPAENQELNDMVNQMVAQAQQPVQMMQPVEPVQMEPVRPVEPAAAPAVSAEPVEQAQDIQLPPPPAPNAGNVMMPPVVPVTPDAPVAANAPAAPAVPAAPVDESAAAGVSGTPDGTQIAQPVEPVNPVVVQPETKTDGEGDGNNIDNSQPVQDPTLVPPVQDPGAFKIPGM